MSPPLRILITTPTFISLGLWAMSHLANAQNISTNIAGAVPLGLFGPSPAGPELTVGQRLGLDEGIKGGFLYNLSLRATYDSNFFLTENNTESELITDLIPQIRYLTDPLGGAPALFSAGYQPVMRAYLDNSDLNRVDHTVDAAIRVEGTQTVVSGYINYLEASGTDRLAGQFVRSSLLNYGVSAAYQIAPRTQLSASATVAHSDFEEASVVGADIYSFRLGANWRATERLSFGPSIRYMLSESANIETRDSWAVFTQAQYQVRERVFLRASLGLEYAETDGDDSFGLTGNLEADYAFRELWVWSSSIRYATIPAPTEEGYVINNLGISTALNRQLNGATAGLGVDLNFSSYERVGLTDTTVSDDTNFGVFISYRRKLFSDRLDFDSRARYVINDGNADWSQLQLSVQLNMQF
ncbi:MAG: hypothetical protein WED15_02740 [Akkermansiaceae bacterium]